MDHLTPFGSENNATIEYIKQRSLRSFMEKASAKYDSGQKEHGGILTDRNCMDEMGHEIIDLWHYYSAERIRQEAKDRYIRQLEGEVEALRQQLELYGSPDTGQLSPLATLQRQPSGHGVGGARPDVCTSC